MMKKTIVMSLMALALNACVLDDDGLELDDTEESRIVVGLGSTLIDIVSWAGAEAGGFVAGEIFGMALPTEAADLSQDALDEIRAIVKEEIRVGWLTQYSGNLKTTISNFNSYSRAECDSGIQDSGECTQSNLENKRRTAEDISNDAQGIYNSYIAWVSGTEETVSTDQDWQVFLSEKIRVTIAIDLAMMRELHEVEKIMGLDESMQASWNTLRNEAKNYKKTLDFIGSKYEDFKGKYGEPEIVVEAESHGDIQEDTIRACFVIPGGAQDCGGEDDIRLETCIFKCESEGPSNDVLLERARARRTARMETLEAMALGSESEFASLKQEVQAIIDLPEQAPTEPEPEPEPAPESEPACGADQLEFSNGPYPGQTSGIYERTGTYNGEPVYTKGKFSIYKRNSKYAADNWVLDQDAVDEEWSGTLTHTENKPSTPWEGTWKVGTAVCK